jgi:hypothetical protein
VVEEAIDDGHSGADPHRPSLRRVMELAESGAIDVVLAKKRNRLSAPASTGSCGTRTLGNWWLSSSPWTTPATASGMALMESYAGVVSETLEDLAPEERHRIYKLLRLGVRFRPDWPLESRASSRRWKK